MLPVLALDVFFGSYGRIGVGTEPDPVHVVAHGPRIVEQSYVELDTYYTLETNGWSTKIMITPAVLGDPFHYTGQFDAKLALRNLYVETAHGAWTFWVGERMLRGDDIYLLDYWPLDNVNTLGGGVMWSNGDLHLSAHVGMNRILGDFQYQQIQVPATSGVGATSIPELDRQRTRATLAIWDKWVKGYVEVEGVPSGTRKRDDGSFQDLPADYGVTAGAEVKLPHLALFLRAAVGLTAYDWLSEPFGFAPDGSVFPGANEQVLGLTGAWDGARAGVQVGAYLRRFSTAEPQVTWEDAIDVRPWLELVGPLQAAVDLSLEQRFPDVASPTALEVLNPTIWAVAPMLLLTPAGPGSYSRPQLRLVYRLAHLDDGARDLYPLTDPRRDREWVHYLGVQAEWWINSTYR